MTRSTTGKCGWPAGHIRLRATDSRPLPTNVDELLAQHGDFLRDFLRSSGSKRTVENLAQELGARGAFSNFEWQDYLPELVTAQCLWGVFQISYGMWCGWVAKSKKRNLWRPKALSGSLYGKLSTYCRQDVLKLYHSSERPQPSKVIPQEFPPEILFAFEEFIRAVSDRIVYDDSQVMVKKPTKPTKRKPAAEFVGWPIGVPANNSDFYRDYRRFVENSLNRYIRPSPSQQIEDVKQHIWMKLIESQTLEKFVAKACSRHIPSKLTANEAIEYLGITSDQWLDLVRQDHSWLQPVEGGAFSGSAVFTREQIRLVEDSGIFPIKYAVPAGDMSKIFNGYLYRVIHNHFANYCRTRTRRAIKDQVVPDGSCRVSQSGIQSPLEGDLTPWEDSLADRDSQSPEMGADVLMTVEGDLNPQLTAQVERINRQCPGRQEDVFSLIADGYTLTEAILKVRSCIREERVRARVA